MTNRIAIITAICGVKEISLYQPLHDNADYYIFTDREIDNSDSKWNIKKLYPSSIDRNYQDRRAAKIPKIMPHYLLPQYDYFIWHDYTHFVKMNPQEIINKYLNNFDFAFFNHPHRISWDTELQEVLNSNLDHKEILLNQKKYYENINIEKNKNFYECTCFVRKNNDVANKVCSLWYEHIVKYSSRDQLSLPAALQEYDPKINTMEGTCQVYFGNNEIIPQFRHSLRLQKLVK